MGSVQPVPAVAPQQELPPLVREYIKQSKGFPTVAPHSRLAGSYAQKMGAGDVKDVDTLICVPGDPQKNDPEAKKLIGDLKKLLDGLPAYLGYEGSAEAQINVERARRSIGADGLDLSRRLAERMGCVGRDHVRLAAARPAAARPDGEHAARQGHAAPGIRARAVR